MSTWKGWGWWRGSGASGGDGAGDGGDDEDDGADGKKKEEKNDPARRTKAAEDDEGGSDGVAEDPKSEPAAPKPEPVATTVSADEPRKPRRRRRQEDENALALDTEAPHVPRVIAIPVSPRPVFPTTAHPLRLTDKKLIETLVKLDRHGKPWLGIFLRKPGRVNEDGVREENQSDTMDSLEEVYDIGTLASIVQLRVDGDEAHLVVSGYRRIRATEMCAATSPLQVRVEHLKEDAAEAGSATVKAYTNELVSTMREVVTMNPMLREFINGFYTRFDVRDPYRLADFAASMATATTVEDGVLIHEVLAAMSLEERLEKALILMRKETALARVQQQISKQVDEKISQNQRKYFLMEQLKQIKKELGMETDDKEALATKFRKRLQGLEVPAEAQKTIDEEFEKLSSLEKNSSEFNVTRTYLDWLTSIPWGKHTAENFDIANARDVLEADHYGMADIKDRILEFIAVGNLKGSVHGKILCFVGPPGVGKTSIGKSIAKALGREYFRFSVGGLSDVSEIKGHRRTYVGAMPGKVIQGLKTVQSSNPLILIDEVDKLGRGMQGDPASALLELLDPSQNGAFVDHYLDTPVDVSKVLFICTANVLDTIPGPLRDRMEIIRLAGYDQPEKREIARQYLDRKAREQTGLDIGRERTPSSLELTDGALDALIRWYCRESGVRNLEKHIERIYRKTALKVVRATEEEVATGAWAITEDNLSDFVGKPVFTSDRLYEETPPGVTMGLAWTSMGGTSLYIETSALTRRRKEGGGSMQVTGKLGEVMQESTRIAQTFARHVLESASPDADFFDRSEVHVHVPEGATPKDGPSAGVTITTSLLSLATGVPVARDVAMTGELSLTGKVLPVGGIKEKVIAARRSGVKHVVLPKGNAKDVEELPDYLKDDIQITLAESYEDVARVAFGGPTDDVFRGKGRVPGSAASDAADGEAARA